MNKSPISQADVTSFLRDMRRTPSGTLVTSKLLAEKIQSTSEAQAIQAFEVFKRYFKICYNYCAKSNALGFNRY
jgi:hypothetical protein